MTPGHRFARIDLLRVVSFGTGSAHEAAVGELLVDGGARCGSGAATADRAVREGVRSVMICAAMFYRCALVRTDTICSCCSAVISANRGSEIMLCATRSATGNAPSL